MAYEVKASRRKVGDLTIRLTVGERARIDAAAVRLDEPSAAVWVRRMVLEAAATDAERAARIRAAIAELQRRGPRKGC